jgi:uncharacterized protein (UPF0335 family)
MAKGGDGRKIEPDDNYDPSLDAPTPRDVGGISGQRLLSFIERVERLNEETAALRADIKEIMKEAKGSGFDVKIIRFLIKIRQQDADDANEFEARVDTYKRAIGMG